MHGRKDAEILDIHLNFNFRHRGIGSRMLKLIMDYLQDGTVLEIWGNITSANVFRKAMNSILKMA